MIFTRCPECATVFRATPEQLEAREGRVRCGQCRSVFDAHAALLHPFTVAIETAPAAAATAIVATPPAAGSAAAVTPSPAATLPPGDDVPSEMPTITGEEASGTTAAAGQAVAALAQPPAPVAREATASFLAPPARATPAQRRQAIAWGAGATLMLLLIAAQAVMMFRNDLALAYPGLRPTLAGWCGALGCELSLPRAVELVGIEASALQPHPTRRGLLLLTATIKNRAAFAQSYPHLELTLTDTRDQPIARRVFTPAEYVTGGAGAFAANAEVPVNLTLDAQDAAPSGYRVEVFFP